MRQVAPHLDIDWDSMSYRPTVFFNEFWTLRENLVPVNGSLSELVIPLDLAQMGLWKFTIFQQVEKSFEMQVTAPPAHTHPRPAVSVAVSLLLFTHCCAGDGVSSPPATSCIFKGPVPFLDCATCR